MYINFKDIPDGWVKLIIDGDTFEWILKNWRPYGKWKWILHLKDWKVYKWDLRAWSIKWCARFSDGSIYEWEIIQWKRCWKWIMRYSNWVVYTWGFKNNKYNGKWILHCDKFDIEWTFKDWNVVTWVKKWFEDISDKFKWKLLPSDYIYSVKTKKFNEKDLNKLISLYWWEISERCISEWKVGYTVDYIQTWLWFYEWPFKECTANWNGKLRFTNGDVYEWEFKNWEMYWKWKLTFNTRWVNEWEFRNGLLNWKWSTSFPSRWTYTWEFMKGKPHWKWKMKYVNWDVYEWEFYMWVANWKWKLTRTNWEIVRWKFEGWKFIW